MLLVMDVGGTKIKYGLAGDDGRLMESTVSQADSPSDGSSEDVLNAFASVIRRGQALGGLRGASVCMPGPFDFENGVSHMKHKFAAIEGVSLRPVFEDAGLEVCFVHDSTAFILGEYAAGGLREAQSPCCVMLGTGLGFAMMRGGRVCEKEDHSPAFTLWNMPYLDGICEDYVSTRAIQRYYGRAESVALIARYAGEGDEAAAGAMRLAGEHLSAILRILRDRFAPDLCALGGQISRSSSLMRLHPWIPLYPVRDPVLPALRGAAFYAVRGRGDTVTTETISWKGC